MTFHEDQVKKAANKARMNFAPCWGDSYPQRHTCATPYQIVQ